jgi:hypothetical protein
MLPLEQARRVLLQAIKTQSVVVAISLPSTQKVFDKAAAKEFV